MKQQRNKPNRNYLGRLFAPLVIASAAGVFLADQYIDPSGQQVGNSTADTMEKSVRTPQKHKVTERDIMPNITPDTSLFCYTQIGFYNGITVQQAIDNPDTPLKKAMLAHFNNFSARAVSEKEVRDSARIANNAYTGMSLDERHAAMTACMNYRQ